MNKQKQAFTLVELIVVITILAILWTIAFISLQWYSKDARDSIRISDVSSMKTSLELFHLDAWKYPLPDNNEIVDYGAEILWYQWGFWITVISSLSRSMSEVPKDPLTDKKYVFSVANNKNEFEILSLLEWDSLALNTIKQTNAASLVVTPKIDGTYNRVFIKTASYIVPVPSIVTSEILTWTMTLDSSNISSQVTNWWENIPEQWNVISNTWALTWLVLSVYTWSIDIYTSNSEKEIVIGKIKNAYTSSVLASSDIYNYILSSSWTEEVVSVLNSIVLKDNITEVIVTVYSCNDATKPADDLNKTYIVNPTSVNQAYVQDGVECWYTCTWWYIWVNCEIAPIITNNDCISAWWMWIANINDVYIGSIQWNGFCISPRVWDFAWDNTWNGISFNGWWNQADLNFGWWDPTSIDDSWNLYPQNGQTKKLDSSVLYTCKSLWSSSTDFDTIDDIVWRMKWLATNKVNLTELQDIEWVQNTIPPNSHPIPVLYIADCIDWVKDLWTDMDYKHYPDENLNETITYSEYNTNESSDTNIAALSNTTYQNRQKYLTAWTQRSGSHLPSAMSYITDWYASASDVDGNSLTTISRWEYQVSCDMNLLTDSNDSLDNERIWLSAVGDTTGAYWGQGARIIGLNNCGDQNTSSTGHRYGSLSARFVIRP